MTTYWFKPKRYGYGVTPATWQGWALTLGTVAVIVAVSLYLRPTERHYWALAVLLGFDAVVVTIFVLICRRRNDGDWRWGNR
jgi:uncharacterized membrane protein HdeD (DUF308 family)